MASAREFFPSWASAPGDTIADILASRGISVTDFIEKSGIASNTAQALLEGRAAITITIARKLESFLGASVEFWISRDFHYRESSERFHGADQQWLADLPLRDMIRFGWLKPAPHPREEVAASLSFFGVSTIQAWRKKYSALQQVAAFRTSPSFESRPAAVAAWLRQGEIESSNLECGAWNPKDFESSLQSIRKLTRQKDPKRFIPDLQKLCAVHGVAVAIVRAPTGCRASGATWFATAKRALLLLSFRHLRDDQFWFSFFHEAGHLLLHGRDRIFLEGMEAVSIKEEQEANEFAASKLVPPEFQYGMLGLRIDRDEIIKFARRIGIAPGIVVGQLQHHKRIKHQHFNTLKRSYTWDE